MTAVGRRDRTGELVDELLNDGQALDDGHDCAVGWTDRARAVPCRVCRPWLAERPARPPTAAELDAFRARWPSTIPPRRRRRRLAQEVGAR